MLKSQAAAEIVASGFVSMESCVRIFGAMMNLPEVEDKHKVAMGHIFEELIPLVDKLEDLFRDMGVKIV